MKTVIRIAKIFAITIATILAIIGIGVVGEQDREYFVAEHQPYALKSIIK